MYNMIKTTFMIVFTLITSNRIIAQTNEQPEINVVYGDKHIFTLETPNDWINDKESAQNAGLVCFFYPKIEINKQHLNYCYAIGYDKETSSESLDDFIKGDLEKFKKKYPGLTFEITKVGITGGLRNAVMYTFSNLTDRFKEEVLYSETDESFIVFSFSAKTEKDYKDYQPVFDGLISSFQYRGNNPKPFLDYMKSKDKK
jgi:hypothetical protein